MAKTVRAKFHCTAASGNSVMLSAVVDGSQENKEFFAATPSGTISLYILNTDARARFTEGADYYVDFTAAAQ